MGRDDLQKIIQNAVSAFERESGLVVDSVDIVKTNVTTIDSRGVSYVRHIKVTCSEPSRPMEPII